MSAIVALGRFLTCGIASRYVKPSCHSNGIVDPSAFDLRDRTPPETYVSFCMTTGVSELEQILSGCCAISKKFPLRKNGAIFLIDIQECLAEVNDEISDLIAFEEKTLPHCGLIYITGDLVKIQEAKTTLCFLARKKIRVIRDLLAEPGLELPPFACDG